MPWDRDLPLTMVRPFGAPGQLGERFHRAFSPGYHISGLSALSRSITRGTANIRAFAAWRRTRCRGWQPRRGPGRRPDVGTGERGAGVADATRGACGGLPPWAGSHTATIDPSLRDEGRTGAGSGCASGNSAAGIACEQDPGGEQLCIPPKGSPPMSLDDGRPEDTMCAQTIARDIAKRWFDAAVIAPRVFCIRAIREGS
jgi:hypothetical protein